jgi:hypothetical protein
MRCPQCNELRTMVRETGRVCCWACMEHEPPAESIPLDCYDKIRENVLCLRVVENRDSFALLFVEAYSNVQAMTLAAIQWGMVNMETRPWT